MTAVQTSDVISMAYDVKQYIVGRNIHLTKFRWSSFNSHGKTEEGRNPSEKTPKMPGLTFNLVKCEAKKI